MMLLLGGALVGGDLVVTTPPVHADACAGITVSSPVSLSKQSSGNCSPTGDGCQQVGQNVPQADLSVNVWVCTP